MSLKRIFLLEITREYGDSVVYGIYTKEFVAKRVCKKYRATSGLKWHQPQKNEWSCVDDGGAYIRLLNLPLNNTNLPK